MPKSGFTLIELIVVMAVIALMAAYTLSNYKSFGEDQNLKNAVSDIQSLLRTAQTNATTNVKCSTQYSTIWTVTFSSDTKTVQLNCQEGSPVPKKTLTLDTNIKILPVSGTPVGFCPSSLPFDINFAPLSGKIDLGANCTSVVVTLQNTKTTITKKLTVEQGGNIYAQ